MSNAREISTSYQRDLPGGGTTGQALVKASNVDFEFGFVTLEDVIWANVADKIGNINSNVDALTTSNIVEGANLYFTNARARESITVVGSGSYDNANGIITITGGVESVNGATGNVVLTTANIAESGNLYFTNARAILATIPATTQLVVTTPVFNYNLDQYSGDNPTIYVTAGETISFDLNQGASHPFNVRVANGGSDYNTGLTHVDDDGTISTGSNAQGKVSGKLFWKIPHELAGNTYVYQCTNHSSMVGNIVIQSFNSLTTSIVSEGTNLYFTNARAVAALVENDVVVANLTVEGNLTVLGNVVEFNANSIIVDDPLLYLAGNNYYSDVVDIGFVGNYYDGVEQRHAGLFRDASDGQFKLFSNLTPEPHFLIDTDNVSFNYANLYVDHLFGNVVGQLGGFGGLTSDDLTQGNVNLYFTNARARAAVSGSAGINYDESSGNFSSGLQVQLVDTANTATVSVANVNIIRFDADSGFDIVDQANGIAKVQMNSTFKTWNVDGQSSLVATGLDTVEFIAGNSIVITTNPSASPQSIRFDANIDISSKANVSDLTTANVVETSNLYFTNTRARAAVGTADASTLIYYEANGNFQVNVTSIIGTSGLTTTDIPEGANLYYSNARARAAFNGGTGIAYTQASGIFSIGQNVATTSNVTFQNVTTSDSVDTQKIYINDGVDNGIIFDTTGVSDFAKIYANTANGGGENHFTIAVGDNSYNDFLLFLAPSNENVKINNYTVWHDGIGNTRARGAFSAGSGISITDGVISYSGGTGGGITYTDLSAVDAGGYGSFSYNNLTGAFTYTGPSTSDVRSAFSAGTGISITNGVITNTSAGGAVSSVNGQTGAVSLTTSHISEGSNQYFTTTRARASFSAGSGISISSGVISYVGGTGGGITYTDLSAVDAGGYGSFSYNDTTGAFTYTGPSTSDVRGAFSAGTGISIVNGVITNTGTGSVTSVNGQTGAVSLTTSHISEGSNQYFTTSRARSAFSAGTGVSISSGSISIGQSVGTSDTVTFSSINVGVNGISFPDDAYGGAYDSASITLATAGGEATRMRFTMTNDADDMFEFVAPSNDGLLMNGSKVWHAGNDGAGSGLDADTLDGQQGTYYASVSYVDGLTTSDVGEGTNLYFTNARARAAISVTGNASYDSGTGVIYVPPASIQSIPAGYAGALLYSNTKYTFTATNNQSLFIGTDDNGQTFVVADPAKTHVFLNGILLTANVDYNIYQTNVTLLEGTAANSILTVVDSLITLDSSVPILQSEMSIGQNVTLNTDYNGLSVGPVTIETGYAITVPTGQRWVVMNF